MYALVKFLTVLDDFTLILYRRRTTLRGLHFIDVRQHPTHRRHKLGSKIESSLTIYFIDDKRNVNEIDFPKCAKQLGSICIICIAVCHCLHRRHYVVHAGDHRQHDSQNIKMQLSKYICNKLHEWK